jgi:hypothetical protein
MAGSSMRIQGAEDQELQQMLMRCNGRELMDALMAADMPLGGTNEERIERLLSILKPQDVMRFFSPDTRQRLRQ